MTTNHPFAAVAKAVPAFGAALRRHDADDLAGARAAYLDLIDQPDLAALCLHQLGLIAAAKGEPARAAALFRSAIRLDPGQTLAYHNLHSSLDRMGDAAGAVAALIDLGCVLQNQGQHERAVPVYTQALARDPLCYAAYVNLGTGLAWLGQLPAATRHLLQAAELYGRLVPEVGLFGRRLASRLEGRIEGVAGATSLPPGNPTGAIEKIEDALTTLGNVLRKLNCAEEALACHRQSLSVAPGFALGHWNLSLALLSAGNFLAGWKEYEWRWQWDRFPEPRRILPAPLWRREPLEGKRILVWGEQGYGDILQFAPLVPRLAAQGAEVLFEVPTPLVRLLRQSLDGVRVIERPANPHSLSVDMPLDFVLPQMSLPERLGLTPQDLPLSATARLHPLPGDQQSWAKRLAAETRPKVGLVWAGRPEHAEDALRSMPFTLLRPLLANRRVAWQSLQIGPRAADLAQAEPGSIGDLAPQIGDFADTAAAIANLDLVIAVDTATAHLACGMGKPTWLLLPRVSDWRWSDEVVAGRWYPSLRIFRQAETGDWARLVDQVEAALAGVDFGRAESLEGTQA